MKLLSYKTILFAAILTTAVVLGTQAQEVSDFTFRHLGQADGMLSQRIYTIQQTSDGALWWSTKNAVERYNGVSIRHYLTGDQQVYSDFAGKFIKLCAYSAKEGKAPEAGNLLAFDNKGHIFAYDVVHDKFVQKVDISQKVKEQTALNDILMTAQGVWLATNQGIYFLHGQTLIPVVRNVNANYIIKTGKTLLFCTRQGVLEYSADLQAVPKAATKMRTLVPCDVESGYYDNIYNKVWLGGYASGIKVLSYNIPGQDADCKQVETDRTVIQNPVRSICPYDDHTMLVGIDGLGVYKVNRHAPLPTDKYVGRPLFHANEGPGSVLHGNGIYALLRDIWGNIIIGSYSGGIDIARPVGSTIAIFQHLHNNQQSIVNDHVYCVEQLSADQLMMGTDDGVSIYNQQTQDWKHTCRGSVVLDLCKTSHGSMLAATYGKGILEVAADGSTRQLYSTANGVLQDDHVFRLFYDRDGDLWMGCLDGDLVEQTPSGVRYYPIRFVKDILQLPDGRIVVGTTYGIQLITPSTGKTTELAYAPEDEKDVNRFVHTLYLNDQRELWIGTDGGGIYVYDLTTKKCRHLTTRNGLTSNYVNTIYKDVLGRIMIATERGLSFADPKNTDRIIGVNYCYGVDREYTSRSVVNLSNGHMMFGSTTGAVVIDPHHIQEIDYTAQLNILGVSCGEDGDDAFKEEVYRMLARHELCLKYSQRNFELMFESINLRNQSDIVYQYKVGKEDWNKPMEQQYIRFSNMEPGRHQLAVRSLSRTCGAVLDEVTLTIRIGQPWWNSWWMWIVYICLIALAFYGAWRIYELHDKYMRLVLSNPNLMASPNMETGEAEEGIATEQQSEEGRAEGSEFISQVTTLVVDNLSDSDFNIDRLCREMAMSRTLFYVKLKSYTGKSPQEFIRIIRLERAATLLRNGRPVTDVAALTGFDNPKYFSTVFKKYFGVSPSKYK